jgi:hypothetical protein
MNKHLKLAIFMAPLLALIAYGLTGYWTPKKDIKAGSYQLQQGSDCSPLNNSCLLNYADFELKLISKQKQDKLQLAIVSNQTLDALSLAMSTDNVNFKQFKIMKSENHKYWQVYLEDNQELNSFQFIRLACQSQKSSYFIETGIRF